MINVDHLTILITIVVVSAFFCFLTIWKIDKAQVPPWILFTFANWIAFDIGMISNIVWIANAILSMVWYFYDLSKIRGNYDRQQDASMSILQYRIRKKVKR